VKTVGLTQFVFRQTKPDFTGTKLTEQDLHDLVHSVQAQMDINFDIYPGYAPFCKVVLIENLGYNIKASYVTRDEALENEAEQRNSGYSMGGSSFEEAGYESRVPGEPAMPVTPAIRWLGDLPMAKELHVVIYSREQLKSEGDDFSGADWDIVSVNAEMESDVKFKDGVGPILVGAPMTPSTMIRNYLGEAWGGSPKPVNLEEYKASVEFWSEHCLVK